MPTPLIRAGFITGLPTYVRQLGYSLDPVLASVGLTPEQLEDPSHFLPLEQEVLLLDRAADFVGREDLMLSFAQRQDLATFGVLGALATGSDTLASALKVFQRYLHYGIQEVAVELELTGEAALFVLTTGYQPAARSPQFWNHGVALMCQAIRLLLGRDWAPRLTFLDRPAPDDLTPYAGFFRSPLAFGQGRNGLSLPLDILEAPIRDSLTAIPYQLRRRLNEAHVTSFRDQVRQIIASLLTTRRCTSSTVAAAMGFTERTLQRRLRAEGTRFQEQLDHVRSALAVNYLREPQFRLADVSELLGYAEQSVFSRSFRRWFGVTPRAWRARHRLI